MSTSDMQDIVVLTDTETPPIADQSGINIIHDHYGAGSKYTRPVLLLPRGAMPLYEHSLLAMFDRLTKYGLCGGVYCDVYKNGKCVSNSQYCSSAMKTKTISLEVPLLLKPEIYNELTIDTSMSLLRTQHALLQAGHRAPLYHFAEPLFKVMIMEQQDQLNEEMAKIYG